MFSTPVAIAGEAAHASEPLGDLDISNLSLAVNQSGEALLTYTRQNGQIRHVLAWGAVNALPPSQTVAQVRFRMDYSGGLSSHKNPGYWQHFSNQCRPYDGPALADVVVACNAPDGSYWAVQSWQRLLPVRGVTPFKPEQAAFGFNLSHWTGPTAALAVSQNWTYGGTWTALFGQLTYDGSPVFGYKMASATRRSDGYSRFVYIDTYNSAYGPGWEHDTAITTHVGDGAFCYSFVPQPVPASYPPSPLRGPGNGALERVTVLGPGVTPDVQWVGPGLGAYDPAQDAIYNGLFDQLVGPNDKVCAQER